MNNFKISDLSIVHYPCGSAKAIYTIDTEQKKDLRFEAWIDFYEYDNYRAITLECDNILTFRNKKTLKEVLTAEEYNDDDYMMFVKELNELLNRYHDYDSVKYGIV